MTSSEREELIVAHIPFAKNVAKKMLCYIPKNVVDGDDIISQALLGLVYAANTYDEKYGTRFAVFAEARIKGCVQDYLRDLDHLPKEERRRTKRELRTIDKYVSEQNREVSQEEIEENLGITIREQSSLHQNLIPMISVGIDGNVTDNIDYQESCPENIYFNKNDSYNIKKAIENMEERRVLILALYFGKGIQMKKIGEVLNVTEARISQIIHECIDTFESVISSQ